MTKNDALCELGKKISVTEFLVCVIHNLLKYRKFTLLPLLLFMCLIPLTAYADSTLNVTLKNGLNNLPLADKQITAYERNPNGGLRWAQRKTTDHDGKAEFNLEGIDSGRVYVLKAKPYNTGSVYSEDVTAAGNFDFLVGMVELTLINGATGELLPNTKVYARRILDDGNTKWYKWGISDSEGVVRFDLAGLGNGTETYLFKAKSTINGRWKSSEPVTNNGPVTFVVGNTPLHVTLKNAINGTALPDQKITVYEKSANGSKKWTCSSHTDSNGKVTFDIDGIDDDRTFALRAKPYNTGSVYSDDLSASGDYDFLVGKVELTLINGATGELLPDTKVYARKILGDGSTKWYKSGTSNSEGVAHFDLAGLGSGTETYLFKAKSTINGRWRSSDPVTDNGPVTFVVGNTPLNVTLKNGLHNTPLPNKEVSVYERLQSGKSRCVGRKTTDAEGMAVFDIEGLGSQGRIFVLKAKPYNTGSVYSNDVTETGDFDFLVGKVELTLINGATGELLPDTNVYARRILGDGNTKWYKSGISDSEGVVRFDLAGLHDNAENSTETYLFKAKSTINGRWRASEPVTDNGPVTFIVGNTPLNVTLKNGIHNTPLPNKDVYVYERLEDGKSRYVDRQTTDSEGKVVFDIEDLGSEGHIFVLKAKPYNTGSVYSNDVTETGDFDFLVGKVELTLINGATGELLPDTNVYARRILDNGNTKWYKWGISDSEGITRFDLAGLDSGTETYLFKAKSTINGRWRSSEPITSNGSVTFVVGNTPLNVTLKNAISGATLPDQKVTVYERLADGSKKWTYSSDTDSNGKVIFDIDGIDDGRTFVLRAKPYNAGSVYSDDLMASGDYDFLVGKMPVTLIDKDNGVPIINKKISAKIKLPNGQIKWAGSGISDNNGTVHFDLDGFSNGFAYVFNTYNAFGLNKSYYSDIALQEGPMIFEISRNGDYSLDRTPPFIAIATPKPGAFVSSSGFNVSGMADDNQLLTRVSVSIEDPLLGTTMLEASSGTGNWNITVTGDMVSVGETVTVIARAYDRMLNVSSDSIQVSVIHDVEAPSLSITSHNNGDVVADAGFLVAGNVSDITGVAQLTANVEDSFQSQILPERSVEVSVSSGRWAFVVNNLNADSNVVVSVEAVDMAGNTATQTVDLSVIPAVKSTRHLLDRITFGTTSELLEDASTLGVDGLINQQLHPGDIDNTEFETALAAMELPDNTRELQFYQLLHTLYSKQQLLEVMTFFWDNHFNTDITKTKISYEINENQQFRQNALGNFRNLLEISAKSPAMLRYLDNYLSRSEEPNENYARELMELHTLSVNGGYTATDVAEVARVFTGWGIRDNEFYFNQYHHDDDEKLVLGTIIPAGSRMQGGEQVLDVLASHPSTARFICTKLVRMFISDTPADGIINECSTVFLNAKDDADQIAQVVDTILHSDAFADTQNFHGKLKTPLEFIGSVVRNINAVASSRDTQDALNNMGMPLFLNPIPTGWSETGPTWLNSNQLLQRLLFANRVAFNRTGSSNTFVDNPSGIFTDRGYETLEGVVGYLFYLALSLDYTELEWNEAVSLLTDNGSSQFDIFDESADNRIRKLIGFVFSFPNYQLQ